MEERNYLHRAEDVALMAGVAAAIAAANSAGAAVVIVTNQAGIGRGYYDWRAFAEVQKTILSQLAAQGASVDAVLACAYHAEGRDGLKMAGHPWRKPNCGMLLEANRLLGVDMLNSTIVGDTVSDIKAGQAAGLSSGALSLTGHGSREVAAHAALVAAWQNESNFNFKVVESPAVAIYEWLG